MIIKRAQYLKKLKPFINDDIIKIISGIRRCGKSTLLKQIIEELKDEGVNDNNIIYINLELKEYNTIKTTEELDETIMNKIGNTNDMIYLLIDEIQEVENWEKLINAYLAEGGFDIYITGSNSKLLSGELSTYLTGRYVEIKIYPFSYSEFLEYKQAQDSKETFIEYLKFGGMPKIIEYEADDKIQYLTDLFESTIRKDVEKRHNIKNIDLLDRLARFIMDNTGQVISGNSIMKYLKKEGINISINTIYNYLSYLEEACLIHKVKRQDLKGKKILNHLEKFYLTDVGFRDAICESNEKNIGQILENLVYIELLRRGYRVNIGKLNNKEVDFVCKKGDKKFYIQVSYLLSSEETIKREFEPLEAINDNYPKYVISMDEFNMSRNGIKHINAVEFLKKSFSYLIPL